MLPIHHWLTERMLGRLIFCVCVFWQMNKCADDINIWAELMFITVSMCVSCSPLHGSAYTAPGEITILLAEAVIGSQGGGILRNLVSTALTARLYSLFLNLPLPRKLFSGPWSSACLPFSKISHKSYEQTAWNVLAAGLSLWEDPRIWSSAIERFFFICKKSLFELG